MLGLIYIYMILTLFSILYTYHVYNSNNQTYLKEVHLHLKSIMFYHMTIVSIFCYLNPEFLNSFEISVMNTMFSIMFSVLFYFTPNDKLFLKHLYNALYLFFASILFADLFLYFKYPEIVYGFIPIYVMFLINTILYNKNNRKNLYIFYIIISIFSVISSVFVNKKLIHGFIIASIYGLAVLGWEYIDHDYLENKTMDDHLNDALKYFFDVEGMFVRYSVQNS